MLPRSEIRSKLREGGGNEKLLREIEAINNAMYSKNRLSGSISTFSSRSKSIRRGQIGDEKVVHRGVGKDECLTKEKKPSFWNWKPLKALSHIRNRRFNCRFSLHVHDIEGLPICFDHSKLSVHWKRRDGEMETKAFGVVEGRAEVDEKLNHVCSVYGSSNGLHHSAKYEAKHFLVYPLIVGVPHLDLGKHRVDLTRLLPLTLEDLEAEKSTGKWSTSFKLSGKGKGATLNVSFGYTVLGDTPILGTSSPCTSSPESQKFKQKFSSTDKPVSNCTRGLRKSTTKPQNLTMVGRSAESTSFLKSVHPDPVKVLYKSDQLNTYVYPTPDLDEKNKEKNEDSAVAMESPAAEEGKENSSAISVSVEDSDGREITVMCEKQSPFTEAESALHDMSDFEQFYQNVDEVADSVECDFLNMMGIENIITSESEPESPRERLLRQFEEESSANGYNLFDFCICDEDYTTESEYTSSLLHKSDDFEEAEKLRKITNAEMIEGLEAEMLMNEWGFSEDVFEDSPTEKSGGFGSPIDSCTREPLGAPPLGCGLGPFVKTSNGGFLRSMNPTLFSGARNGGGLIMQVSRPVVVPAEMGSGVMEILQRLASSGIEKLSLQADHLMPLEDITGSTIQQLAWENAPSPSEKMRPLEAQTPQKPTGTDADSEYVSLEELAPLAMDKMEALSIEGLRIQSGLWETDAPSAPVSLDGITGVRLLEKRECAGQPGGVEGLMSLSLTLDEWVRLDSGRIEDAEMTEKTSKILAAHHADRGGGRRRCGLLGNDFTVAFMVQLRDPGRDYEPVGVPMLALIQVERAFLRPKTKIYTVGDERPEEEEEEEEGARFRVAEVHMAGSRKGQPSGSRWLAANGMGKGGRHGFVKNSMCSGYGGIEEKDGCFRGSFWSIVAALNPYRRRPSGIVTM